MRPSDGGGNAAVHGVEMFVAVGADAIDGNFYLLGTALDDDESCDGTRASACLPERNPPWNFGVNFRAANT